MWSDPPVDVPPSLAERPAWPAGHDAARTTLDALFRAAPFHATLGIALRDWGPGWAQVTLRPGPALANLAGSTHGGVAFALADAAFEVACNAYGRLAVALETACHYLRPAPLDEELLGDAWEIGRGGRTASYRLQVSAGGQPTATYLALAYRTSRWHVPAEQLPAAWR